MKNASEMKCTKMLFTNCKVPKNFLRSPLVSFNEFGVLNESKNAIFDYILYAEYSDI